jgi:hypothetical protein
MAKRKRQTMQWPKEKDRHYNDQRKKNKMTMIHKTLHSEVKIVQHKTQYKPEGRNSCAPAGLAVPVQPVAFVVVLLNDTNII